MNRTESGLNGVIVVDKPAGWTSHDVVAKMRGIAGTRSVGHLGTLDPLATGVLPLMIGNVTRLARYWEDSGKSYEAVIRFGFATTTYDREGESVGAISPVNLTAEQVREQLARFEGETEQIPPPVSAKKINGVPAYKLTRQKIKVDLAPVKIRIRALSLTGFAAERATISVHCSAGTYVRSIAHDLGQALGCGAHIEELVRTASGPFRIEDGFTLEALQVLKNGPGLQSALIPPADLLPHFPNVFVDELTVIHIRQGRNFNVSPFRVNTGTKHVKAIGPDGNLVGIGSIVLPNLYHPEIVLN